MYRVINADCLAHLAFDNEQQYDCIFADPPDNLGLEYTGYNDLITYDEYIRHLKLWVYAFARAARHTWLSFNARYTVVMGTIVDDLCRQIPALVVKPCVQTFTFGQHNHKDLGNNHRPLWRISHIHAPLYTDAIRVPSWRQLNGDKRADPRGRVPGDVFEFPRVTGNSKQRRTWHPTQLHESLVERCIKLTTKEGDRVLDPFGGTGTTLRVCRRINRQCDLIEIDPSYCAKIREENEL